MLPMFYQEVAALNSDKHQDTYIEALNNFDFARKSNSIIVGINEFSHAALNYPVVFVSNDDQLMPVAVTGLNDQENIFIDAEGQWLNSYIPAYIRRFPFILAKGEDNQFTICIDEAYSGLNKEKRGSALFTDGQQSDYLKKIIEFIKGYEDEMERTRMFCKQIKELDILEQSHAVIERPDQEKASLSGFWVINREKLDALSEEKIYQLQQNGSLEIIYQHLLSMPQFKRLFER